MLLGIDLGGTKIAAALTTTDGKIITDVNIPTEAAAGKARVIENIKKAVPDFRNVTPKSQYFTREFGLF